MGKFGMKLNLVLISYIVVSMQIFNKVFRTSKMVIDEEFHLRQGLHYCNKNFSVWDPKITTFPGLYVVSTLLFGFINSCSVYHLRLTNLISSVVNVILIYKIREHFYKGPNTALSKWNLTLETLTIAILPPMYFFSFVYYTDIISITFVLAMTYFNLKNRIVSSSFMGVCSVAMRQTNIVWVGVVFGSNLLNDITQNRYKKLEEHFTVKENVSSLVDIIKCIFTKPIETFWEILSLAVKFSGFILIFISFIVFLFYNGSIAVGDKSAHEAKLHLPQICYFIMFLLFFEIKTSLTNLQATLTGMKNHLFVQIILVFILILVIHLNTIVHPYLLADNRHFTFYIWNRFYGRHSMAKFVIIPVYILGLNVLYHALKSLNSSFRIFYIFGLFATIALQQMIEVRYFFIPFLLLKLLAKDYQHYTKRAFMFTVLEFIMYVAVNGCAFYLFFTKEIRWNDYNDVQRIIW